MEFIDRFSNFFPLGQCKSPIRYDLSSDLYLSSEIGIMMNKKFSAATVNMFFCRPLLQNGKHTDDTPARFEKRPVLLKTLGG